jgi:hypothetical protein
MSEGQFLTKGILGILKHSGVKSSKKDESNASKLSNISVQYYYKMKPKESLQDSAQYIIDNIDTSNNNIRKPDFFLYDYEIIGKVITRKIKHMVSSLEAFIILKETENPADENPDDNNKKITHFMGLNFNKELTIDKKYNFNNEPMEERTVFGESGLIQHANKYPTLYNHLFGLPEFEITDDKLNLKYTIYNKRFYDDI